MDLTISRPIKIFVLVAVIAIAGGASMLMMKPKQAAAPPVVVTKPPVAPTSTTSAAPTRQTTTAAASTTSTTATAAPATKAIGSSTKLAAKPAVTRAAVAKAPPVGANGLPTVINAAFATHSIVVVSVFDPESSTDAISYAEARAGAADARVGFVGVSLLDNPLSAALTTSLPGGGLLPAPGVLIYRKPGVLVQRIDGFADRDAVAQAAAAAVTAAPVTGSGS